MPYNIDHAVNVARAVAGCADAQALTPTVRLIAWRTLVEARGGIFRRQTLPAAAHVKPAAVPSTLQQCLDMHSPAVIARIHAQAAKIGIHIPYSTGGDAA